MPESNAYSQSPATTSSIEDLRAYWTPERMRNAIPTRPQALREIDRSRISDRAEGRNLISPARPPLRSTATGTLATSYSAVQVSNPLVFPYSSTGKLFYTQNGINYVASASAIYTNTILTAAHTLFSFATQQWSTNMLFVPAYTNGQTPLGSWAISTGYTLSGYSTTGLNDYDIGMATTTPLNMGATTGYLGMAVNEGWNGVVWQALGYPASPNPPYDGTAMWSCTGPTTGLDPSGTVAVGMQSNFTTGASGGPWLINGSYNANGVSSYGYASTPDIEYSPYFGNGVWQMFMQIRS
jgi:V8-like Glu-specific endopeptidase